MAGTRNGTSVGDRRVRRTHAALQQTLIRLVEEQDLSQISVADVAERAGVSRSTFYDHYRDVHELAEAACTAMIDDLIESLPVLGPGSTDQSEDGTRSLLAFFVNLAEHAGLDCLQIDAEREHDRRYGGLRVHRTHAVTM
ncbi:MULTISPECIES: TetR/AcrR family transcriptional regulator [Pseudofrankia]|uniref:TetR/AcrR family transcriptional regulator n=1 Tax=Pseudofrankia TaxID=2994363 RepID=UPI0003135778|nr:MULTISPECIES: TetR/AcrR family transcriptional regulator [Pseudofrankia]